jgi:hypothetical protein
MEPDATVWPPRRSRSRTLTALTPLLRLVARRCHRAANTGGPEAAATPADRQHPGVARARAPDNESEPRPFTFLDGEPLWTTTTRSAAGGPLVLTYAFWPAPATVDHLPPDATCAAFRRAFERWARVIPVEFVEITDDADITVGFYEGDYGDGAPFDGPLNVLAHA